MSTKEAVVVVVMLAPEGMPVEEVDIALRKVFEVLNRPVIIGLGEYKWRRMDDKDNIYWTISPIGVSYQPSKFIRFLDSVISFEPSIGSFKDPYVRSLKKLADNYQGRFAFSFGGRTYMISFEIPLEE